MAVRNDQVERIKRARAEYNRLADGGGTEQELTRADAVLIALNRNSSSEEWDKSWA